VSDADGSRSDAFVLVGNVSTLLIADLRSVGEV
jgi:hypothetical protein